MNHFIPALWVAAFALSFVHLSAQPAKAASGVVSGVLLFYQNQGTFCPDSRDCTGAKYTEAEYNTNQPFRDAKIYIRRQGDDETVPPLGQGVTDGAGFFSIAWYDPAAPPFSSVPVKLEYRGEHANGRYYFVNWIPSFDDPPLPGGTPVEPLIHEFTANSGFQWIDFPVIGDGGGEIELAQMHDGAHMMWTNSLAQSFRMLLTFSNLEIQYFASFSVCSNSCAVSRDNFIIIGSNSDALNPQSRIMHEMGHVANYLANPDWTDFNAADLHANDYSRDGEGWTFATAEHEGAAWEESMAQHYADVGMYYPWAAVPYSCSNEQACPVAETQFNIALEPTGSCGTDSDRRAQNHIRYHWDNYDYSIDYAGELLSVPVYDSIDTVNAYPPISGEGGIDEMWNVGRTALDDLDGRSTRDFANYLWLRGVNSNVNLAVNCGSAGD